MAVKGRKPIPVTERVKSKVATDSNGCWIWQGYVQANGYAKIGVKLNGKHVMRYAHRVMYEETVGPVPEGLDLDHLCRVRRCVNPEHLEPVTRSENLLRGDAGIYARQVTAKKTHCKHGHPLSGDNLYTPPGTNKRHCKECNRQRSLKCKLNSAMKPKPPASG